MSLCPTEDEAAAIVAAVERFVADTAPAAEGRWLGVSPWQRTALLEGVSAKAGVAQREGGDRWLS